MKAFALFSVLALLLPMPAFSATQISSTNPAGIAAFLKQKGYRAELATDKTGEPYINSATGGTDFTIVFYNCTKGKDCTTIQFFSWFKEDKFSVSKANEWNKQWRFASLYLDDEANTCLQMDLNLDKGGMSEELFGDNLLLWEDALARAEKFVFDND